MFYRVSFLFIILFLISRRPYRDRNLEYNGLVKEIGILDFFTRLLLSTDIRTISEPYGALRDSGSWRMMMSSRRLLNFSSRGGHYLWGVRALLCHHLYLIWYLSRKIKSLLRLCLRKGFEELFGYWPRTGPLALMASLLFLQELLIYYLR